MGCYWAINYAVSMFTLRGKFVPLGWLPLLGFFVPLLYQPRRRCWRRLAFWFCLLELGISFLSWYVFLIHSFNPRGVHVTLLGIPLTVIWDAREQLFFFLGRALLFLIAAILIASGSEKIPPDPKQSD
jgi:hypothetical protein